MNYIILKCHICQFECKQELRFTNHLTFIHNISDHLSLYLKINNFDKHPTCQCKTNCTSLLPWVGWKKGFTSKYSRGHNARIDSVYLNKDMQQKLALKRKESFASGKIIIWNKGLTKKSSNIILESSNKISATLSSRYESGDLINWHNLDKEKSKIASNKISKTKQKQILDGTFKVWNTGLTKETNLSLRNVSEKISNSYKNREMGNRLSIDDVSLRINKFSHIFDLITDDCNYTTRRIDRLAFKCKFGHIQLKSLAMLEDSPICFLCHPNESKGQIEIFDFIKSLGVNVELSNRVKITPKELDVYVSDKNFAVEYNGLYWHSLKFIKDQKYHQKKLDECKKNNINLLSIYEDEWRDKKELIKKMIMHRLRISTEKLDARKMKVIKLDKDSATSFFNANHLEGYARSNVSYGLLDPKTNRIVAGLSLRTPFHKKHQNCLEVARCCPLAGISVRGWLGRLTKIAKIHAKDTGINKIMTYVDARVGLGDGYKNAGWSYLGTTNAPRFWWTDFENRFNRFKYKADKTRNMTQRQIADEANVVEIFGCTNSMWEINI
jgi:hypothetical protein